MSTVGSDLGMKVTLKKPFEFGLKGRVGVSQVVEGG